tara:strand:+ start:7958 stop:8170 length:213 start_codon:yes stop_codon:yes gene_type:complete
MKKLKLGIIQIYNYSKQEGRIIEEGGTKSYRFTKKDIIVKFLPNVGQKVLYKIKGGRGVKAVSIQPYAYF